MDSDTAAFLIQRAWRRYRRYRGGGIGGGVSSGLGGLGGVDQEAAEEEVAQRTLATSGYMTASISSCFSSDIMRNSNSFSDWMRVSASNTEDNLGGATVCEALPATSAANATPLRSRRLEQLKEADSLSIMSDCSELMGEVGKLMKEQLASQDALLRPRLHPLTGSERFVDAPPASPPTTPTSSTSPQRSRFQQHQEQQQMRGARPEDLEEAAEEARREERKANFLSLAQEFAELKRRNAHALPFNLHRLGRSDFDDSDEEEEQHKDELDDGENGQHESGEADECAASKETYQLVQVPLTALTAPEMRPCREERLAELFSGTTAPSVAADAAALAVSSAEDGQAVSMRRETAGLSERERVLQALSMSAEDDDDSGLASASAAAGWFGSANLTSSTATTASSATATMTHNGEPNGMEMCFRNDAASDSDCSDEASHADALGGAPKSGVNGELRGQQQPRRRRAKVSQAAAPMQLCFISDLTSDEEDDNAASRGGGDGVCEEADEVDAADAEGSTAASAHSSTLVSDSGICDSFKVEMHPSRASDSQMTGASLSASGSGSAMTAAGASDGCAEASEVLLTRQARLQAEAQLALAQARPMARMQLEVERHEQRSRASRDLVAELMGVSSTAARRFHRAHLQQLSLGALQVIHNDLLSRIETHNEDLVRSLIERDDLHMEQDSMLVEVEDLTRRAQEVASRLQEPPKRAQSAATGSDGAAKPPTMLTSSPVRRKMSSLTSRLKPNKLVSLFTGGGGGN